VSKQGIFPGWRSARTPLEYAGRRRFVLLGLLSVVFALSWRAVELHVIDGEFYRSEGDARQIRALTMPSHRGVISDRNGEPLAISTPVKSVWINPQVSGMDPVGLDQVAQLLDLRLEPLRSMLQKRAQKSFVYLKRQVSPELAEQVAQIGVTGLGLSREYRRFYPSGEVSAHLIGFTDIDHRGQEGLERAYDHQLRGEDGSARVVRDGARRVIAHMGHDRAPRDGGNLTLSIDRRLQYLAYRELKSAVIEHQARSGSAVLMDAHTGEVLAMVNQPAYNPNSRKNLKGNRYRNRAVTDVFEPGSTVKPFVIASGLESGQYYPHSKIDTTPGQWQVGGGTIRDHRDYGVMDLGLILSKSSNIGAAKIASSMAPETLWAAFAGLGFGVPTNSGYPGESAGVLPDFSNWQPLDHATLGFGYGLSTTALQLAQAYSVLAADGYRHLPSVVRVDQPVEGQQVFSAATVLEVTTMLEGVVSEEGTGRLAQIPGYRVAGKTGTVRKAELGGYSDDRYVALFAGYAPASAPRLVLVVVVDEPSADVYYGGQVAAPVFARIMGGALRLLDISPDALSLRDIS